MVKTKLCLLTLFAAGVASHAVAQTCAAYPNTLTNGTTADANQVMANFNAILGCANTSLAPLANPAFTGKVGIGTTAPAGALDIVGGANAQLLSRIINTASGANVQAAFLLETGTANSYGSLGVVDNSGSPFLYFSVGSGIQTAYFNLPSFYVQNLSGAPYLSVTSSGAVGVDTASPSSTLFVNGSSGGTQSWTVSSDARLKTDVRAIPDALDIVEHLRGVSFEWRAPAEREVGKDLALSPGQRQFGFIAQEVEQVAPEVVSKPKTPGGTYGVSEDSIVPILVEAVKAQQAEITKLKAEVAALKEKRGRR